MPADQSFAGGAPSPQPMLFYETANVISKSGNAALPGGVNGSKDIGGPISVGIRNVAASFNNGEADGTSGDDVKDLANVALRGASRRLLRGWPGP